ncbi:MAG: class I SAM-dependent methyltransferase [Candidatus Scalinduaceae bacterium]
MPVTDRSTSKQTLFQRDQYAKGGVNRVYWDYRDMTVISLLDQNDRLIVDLGCGEGLTLQKLVRMFSHSEILGIDLLEENIEVCLKYDLPARKGDVYKIDLPKESVDAVLFMEVVEHLDRPVEAISQIHRILKPGGKLVIVFPNDRFFKLARIMTLKIREAFYDPGHLGQWTPRGMKHVLIETGFEVYYSKFIPFLFWKTSLHCVIGARKI